MDVDAEYMATNMVALVCGNSDMNTDEFNACDKANIAGPDNVAYVLGHDALIIGARPALLPRIPSWCTLVCLFLHCNWHRPRLPLVRIAPSQQ